MSKSFWLDSKASIILLPSGKQGSDLFELACNWAEVGLIGPALWIRPEAVELVDGQPPRIEAEVIGVGPERELTSVKVDLFEQLAREALSVIRFVKVRSTSLVREFDEHQDQVVSTIEDYLGWALPSPDKRLSDRDERQVFEVINLICAPTEFKVQKRLKWMTPGRGVTLLAAPEDRSNPWATDAFVRENKKFPGFTMMHLATAAGIWNGLPIGTLDLFQKEKSTREGIWISRTFVAGVLTDGLARRVAASVLGESADSDFEPPLPPIGTSFIEDDNLDLYINNMVQVSFNLDSQILEYKRPADLVEQAKPKLAIVKQFVSFLKFSGQKLGRMPYWSWMWIKRLFAKSVERNLQGTDGKYEVGVGLEEPVDIHDKLVMSRYASVREAEEKAQKSLQSPVHLGDLRSTPSLWQGLRELVFGALDGGFDLSDRGFAPIENKTPIFRKVSNLFQNPEDAWVFPSENRPENIPAAVGWNDLIKVTEAENVIRSWSNAGVSELEALSGELVALQNSLAVQEADISNLRETLIENGLITEDEDGKEQVGTLAQAASASKALVAKKKSADAGPVSDDEQTDEPLEQAVEVQDVAPEPEPLDLPNLLRDYKKRLAALKVIRKDIESQKALLESLEQTMPERSAIMESFEVWKRANERSFLWSMNGAMATRMATVDSDVANYAKKLNELDLPESGTLLKIRKKFHKRVLITLAILAPLTYGIIAYLDYYRAENPGEPVLSTADILTYSGSLAVFLLLTFLAAYHRGWSSFEREVDSVISSLAHISEGNRICRREQQRLQFLYKQTLEWLELLAKSLANPWMVRPKWLESGLKQLDLETLPFAMRIAQADEGDAVALEKLRKSALTKMAQKGWRYKAFERLVEQVSRVSGTTRGLSIELLDRDLPHSSNNARKTLNQHLLDTVVQERVAVSFLKPMIEELQGEAMTEARPSVLQVEDDPLELLRSDLEGIEAVTREVPWTTFLAHALTLGDGKPDPVTPMSVMSINHDEIQLGVHEEVTSYVILPERVSKELSASATKSLNTKSYSDKVARPLDSVIRVDLAGPISYDIARLWASEEKLVENEPAANSSPQRGIRRGVVG